jgi:hypothetical protein
VALPPLNNDNSLMGYASTDTDKTIAANRPDIIVKDKVPRNCFMVDVSIPSERNVSIKQVDKMSKYKDLEIEITNMWSMEVKTISVVIGALGLMI